MGIIAPLYGLSVLGDVLPGAIHGTGETFGPMLITLLCTCTFRVLWVVLAVPQHPTLMTVLMGYPISWGPASGVFLIYYLHHASKLRRRLGG